MKKILSIISLILLLLPSFCFSAEYQEQRSNNNILIGYIRAIDGASIPLAADNSDYQEVLEWISQGNIADADPNILALVKSAKIQEYKLEGLRLIGTQVPEWNSFDVVAFIASIWNMLGTSNAQQAQAKDIYVYVKNTAIPNVNAQVDIASVQAIDVTNDPNWP